MSPLLRIFGIDANAAGPGGPPGSPGPPSRVLGVDFVLNVGGGGIAWAIIIGLALCAMTVLLYRRERVGVSVTRRYTMAALRCASLALLLLILLRPSVNLTLENAVRRQLLMLVDTSASMTLKDVRSEPADIARATAARAALGAGSPEAERLGATPARHAIVRAMLTGPQSNLLADLSRSLDVRVLPFDRHLAEPHADLPPFPARPAQGSALGDAIRDALARSRGQPLAGIVIVTDGASNAGMTPLSAASVAAAAGVPLYPIGIGVSRPRDLAVAALFAPDIAFVDDEALASLRLRVMGLKGQTGTIRLKLGTKDLPARTITFADDGEALVEIRFTPSAAGDTTLTADVAPLAGEAVADNNAVTVPLRVVDGKIKVLFVETAPRWEFKYVQALLTRDRRIAAKFLLLEASPSVTEGEKTPYLAAFPASREELFKYDLVILGDVDPRRLPTDAAKWMEEHVGRFGAGLILLAGRDRMPAMYAGTALDRLLPVELSPPNLNVAPPTDEPLRLGLTPAGRASAMLRLGATEDASAAAWLALPPIFWQSPVSRARPGAEVLLTAEGKAGQVPLLALQPYGLGASLFIGTDNLWRIRRNTGDALHARLWGQFIQRLSLPHLLGESKRTQLAVDRRDLSAGDTASLFARLYSATYEPLLMPEVQATLAVPGGTRVSVLLRPVPETPGSYRGEAMLPAPGKYSFTVATDPATALAFDATESKLEFGDIAMNESLLRDLARISRGAFLREEDLASLPAKIEAGAEPHRTTLSVPLWSSLPVFILLAALLCTEWALRKGVMLK